MTSHRKPKPPPKPMPDVMDWLYVLADCLEILVGWLYSLTGCTNGRIWWVKVGYMTGDPLDE